MIQATLRAIERRREVEAADRVAFAHRVGVTPDPWQLSVLRSDAAQIILNCSRQTGKSTVSALLALHTAIYMPCSLILILAPALSSARLLEQELLNFKVKIDPQTAHDSYLAWREGQHDDLVLAVALAVWKAGVFFGWSRHG